MAKTRGSRRALVMLASALVLLAATTSAAGASRLQTDCDERPVGIGCDRSTTTVAGEGATGSTEPGPGDERDEEPADTTAGRGGDQAETTLPSADGASAGVNDEGGEDPAPVVDSSDSDDDGGTSPLMLGVVLLLGLGAGVAGGAALMASRQRSAVAPVAAAGPPVGAATADDRRRLVQELIDVRDHVSSEALRASIGSALAEVGVLELSVPAGTTFDPQLHKGVDRVATDDPGLDRTVSETERPGYADRGETVRLPEVVVRRLDTPEAAL
jgi:hypothetical protein